MRQSTDAELPGYFLVGETRLRILPLPVPPRYLLDRDCINIMYTKIFLSVGTLTRENRLKYVIFFLLLKERENDRKVRGGKKPAFDWFFSSHSFFFE